MELEKFMKLLSNAKRDSYGNLYVERKDVEDCSLCEELKRQRYYFSLSTTVCDDLIKEYSSENDEGYEVYNRHFLNDDTLEIKIIREKGQNEVIDTNSDSIEEDIKKQKESLRNWLAMHVLIKENSYMRFNYEDCWNLYKFVENALIKSDDYKRVLKENKELKKENEELKKFITEGITVVPHSPYKNYRLDFLRENFVPKQRIKNEIAKMQEEYNKVDKKIELYLKKKEKTMQELYENRDKVGELQMIAYLIQTLKELLDESEE